MSFSPTFLSVLIYTALAMTGLGVLTLLVLLARDLKDKSLW